MGVTKLMDVVRDRRPYVQTEALVLMWSLCKDNEQLQKLTAFDSAFECIFGVIERAMDQSEELNVFDAFQLMHVLLEDNHSNAVYFRETGCVAKLFHYLKIEDHSYLMLPELKHEIIVCTLRIVRVLLSRNSSFSSESCRLLYKLGFPSVILKLALGRIMPLSVRVIALETLSDLFLDHEHQIQKWFSSINVTLPTSTEEYDNPYSAPSTQSALSRLLTVLLHNPSFNERIAALSAMYGFLRENEDAQIAIMASFTPTPDDIEDEVSRCVPLDFPSSNSSIGRRLLACFFGWSGQNGEVEKADRAWFASKVLGFLLSNATMKRTVLERSIRIQVGTKEVGMLIDSLVENLHNLATPYLHASSDSVKGMNPSKIILISLLNVLSIWMYGSKDVVRKFLSNPKNIPLLVQLTSVYQHILDIHIHGIACLIIAICIVFNPNDETNSAFITENLSHLIVNSIGIQKFKYALSRVRYSKELLEAEQDEFNSRFLSSTTSKIDVQDKSFSYLQENSLWDNITPFFYDFDFALLFRNIFDSVNIFWGARGGHQSGSPISHHFMHRKEVDHSSAVSSKPQQNATRSNNEQPLSNKQKLVDDLVHITTHFVENEAKISEDMRSLLLDGPAIVEIQQDSSIKEVLMKYKEVCEKLIRDNKHLDETVQSLMAMLSDYELLFNKLGKQQQQQQITSNPSEPNESDSTDKKDEIGSEVLNTMNEIIKNLETENNILKEQAKRDRESIVQLSEKQYNAVHLDGIKEMEASLQQV